MQISQHRWTRDTGWVPPLPAPSAPADGGSQLVLTFGPRPVDPAAAPGDATRDAALGAAFPHALHVFCSGGGQIAATEVLDDATVVSAITFDRTAVRGVHAQHTGDEDSAAVGARLAALLPAAGLRHVLVFSDGLRVNGSALVRGLADSLHGVAITGGLAADDDRFEATLVSLGVGGPGVAAPGGVAAVGFYGDALRVGTGTLGGWDMFGPDRLVTRSEDNVLYELDGEPALALYKRYLGPFAEQLPASALLFPLSLRTTRDASCGDAGVVRTILGVDEAAGSMTFAGDIPQGTYARLMKANMDRLIDGATGAAQSAAASGPEPLAANDASGDVSAARFALLVSCVGRRWVLKHRVEEELEGAQEVLGPRTTLAGFYSYGEISSATPHARCELHNQTMTITTLSEAA